MSGRSAIFNLLTCLTLGATGLIVVVVAVLLVLPGILPGFLRQPTQPTQVALATAQLTPQATPTSALAYPTLPPEWTATPSPAPSATDTVAPTAAATETPLASDTPQATASPAASATPTATAAPANVIQLARFANVRSGPGVAYPIVASLNAAQTVPVVGRDSFSLWFAISFAGAPGGTGWVSTLVATYAGNIADLPIVQAAGPPPATAVPATNTPSGPPTATSLPSVGGANGIQTILFTIPSSGSINTDIFFHFKVVNNTASAISGYGILAAHTDQGVTADSWNAPLVPGKVLEWSDHINFPSAGTYQVYLGICYASHTACKTGSAGWTRLSPSVTVTIS